MGDFEFFVLDGPARGQTFTFPGPRFYVGSGADAHIRINSQLLRPKHAEIRFDTKGVPWVRDLGSGELWINGEPKQEGPLLEGSFVRMGDVELAVRARGGDRTNASGTMATPTPMRSGVAGAASSAKLKPLPDPRGPSLDATAKRPTPYARSGTPPEEENLDATLRPSESLRTGALPAGTVIDGRYHIVKKLAAGGMGEVYKAEHVELGKSFALKVMLPELSRDPEFVARFKREAIAASRIGQQNIVDISDFGQTEDGRFYFVMEFLDGLTLASVVHREGPLDPTRAANIGVQGARALAAAHAQGIVHRDLKPENIMLLQRPGQPDFVKVLDFGVAKVAAGQGQGGHTAIGMVVGTPQYMSPEQAKAVVVDARSDIYSFGLILYELLAGKPTFSGETPSILMVKHVTEAPPPLDAISVLPVEFEQLIFQMLEKEPDARPQTMEQVVQVLDTILVQLKANPPAPAARRTRAAPESGVSGVAVRITSGQKSVSSSGPKNQSVVRPLQPTLDGPVIESTESASPPEDELLAPPKSKAPLVVGGMLVLGLAVGVAWVAFKPGEAPTPIEVKPPTPIAEVKPTPGDPKTADPKGTQGTDPKAADPSVKPDGEKPKPVEAEDRKEDAKLLVTTVPPGAEVTEGDVLLGKTPFTLERKKDSIVELSFSLKGYVPMKRKLGFATSEITIELEKKREAPPPRPVVHTTEDLKDNPF